MRDWNVIVTVNEHGYKAARHYLKQFGLVADSDFFNVLVLKVEDVAQCLEKVRQDLAQDPGITRYLARFLPVTRCFHFQTVEEFEQKAQQAVQPWIQQVAGKDFHVRLHRRGFKGRLSTPEEERFLDDFLLKQSAQHGAVAHMDFQNPDVIIAVETLGQRAGLSLWTRHELQRYPFLKID